MGIKTKDLTDLATDPGKKTWMDIKRDIPEMTGAGEVGRRQEAAALAQAAATREAAASAAKSSLESAAQAARSQEGAAARNAAEKQAGDTLAIPLENPDINLAPVDGSASAGARKRRQTFGIGSGSSGVNI